VLSLDQFARPPRLRSIRLIKDGTSKPPVEVPDLIGPTFTSARAIGANAGRAVIGHAPDGAAVPLDLESIAVEQLPNIMRNGEEPRSLTP